MGTYNFSPVLMKLFGSYLIPHQVGIVPDVIEPYVGLEQLVPLVQIDDLVWNARKINSEEQQ
jgi:hypothetical protein